VLRICTHLTSKACSKKKTRKWEKTAFNLSLATTALNFSFIQQIYLVLFQMFQLLLLKQLIHKELNKPNTQPNLPAVYNPLFSDF
jgi:hypothetical protein